MSRALVLAMTALALHPVAAHAQQGRGVAVPCGPNDCIMTPERAQKVQAKADALRAVLEYPDEVDWPSLPRQGRIVVHTGQPDRTDVPVPQYAYYYSEGFSSAAACLPVVIVQAQGSTLGWVAILDSPPALGGAEEQFFDLLGTERPN